MKNSTLLGIAALGLSAALFTACNKEEVDTETQSATDNSMAENEFALVFSNSNQIVIKEEGMKKVQSGCHTVIRPDTVANPGWPRTAWLDYGTTGCVWGDGRVRTGKCKITATDYWRNFGSKLTVELVDYYVNGLKHTGTLVATNRTQQGANTRLFDIDVTNASIITGNGTINWESHRTIQWLQGFNTDTISDDDIFDITGSASGTNRKGKSYTANITSPVRYDGSCDWIPSGILELTPEGLSARTIDFGSGTCDNKAVVTINGKSFEITMQ